MTAQNITDWANAFNALVPVGILIEQEFVALFNRHHADMTPDEQHAALVAIKTEADRRKSLADSEVADAQAKIAGQPVVMPPDA